MVLARVVASDPDPVRTGAVADATVELLTRAPFAVVVHDDALVVTGWNEAAARCFGVAADAAVGRPLAGLLMTEADAAAWRAALGRGETAASFACTRIGAGPLKCAWQAQAIAGAAPTWICIVTPAPRASLDERVLTAVLDNLPISIWAVDRRGDYVFHDGLGVAQLGIERRSWIGLNLWKLWGGNEGTADTLRQVQAAMDSNKQTHAFAEAMGMTWETWCVPLPGDDGAADLVVSVTMDITPSRRAEVELRERLATIEHQQKMIKDLATPIIEVWEGVLTVPLMGSVDGERTTELMERMLAEVARKRARHAILDLTGVEVVDARTAAYIIDLVRAIRLLGAEAILTGIGPGVAQIFVDVGADLSKIPTRSNLRSGLEHCMQRIALGAARKAGAARPGA